MAKIELDTSNIYSGCTLNIGDTVSLLQKAVNYSNNFNIPYDFKKKSELKRVINELESIINNLNSIKKSISDSCSNYETLISNLENQSNNLATYSVKTRNNII